MNRLEQIKDEVARSKGLGSWSELDYKGYIWDSDIEAVCEKYAKECIKASLEKASQNVKMKLKQNIYDLSMMDDWSEIDKDSITNSENIVLL